MAPSGAVVEQVVSPMGWAHRGPIRRLSPSARNLPTKAGSGTLPPDTTAKQSPKGEIFQRDTRDEFDSIPKACLQRHTDGKQHAAVHTMKANKAVLQTGTCFGGKVASETRENHRRQREGLESFLIVLFSNEINPFICAGRTDLE